MATIEPFSLSEARTMLGVTAPTLTALLGGLPARLLDANEGPDTWSPRAILQHLVWGEADDWMPRVRHLREFGTTRPFRPFDREEGFRRYADWSVDRLLVEFTSLRAQGLDALDALAISAADLAVQGRHPEFGVVTLEQLIATWTVHDLAHLSQITRVLARDVGRHVGPWREYFSLLRADP